MKILFAASEAAPFIKTGGLGDVAQALPQELAKSKENEICLFVPYYKSVKYNPNFKINFVTSFEITLGWRTAYVGVFRTKLKNVTYYFIDNEYYFSRDGSYGFFDDGERYAYFCKAILETILHIDFIPDVIHCNDWQTALIPLMLKSDYSAAEEFKKAKTVFTIHNIEYQGKASNEFLTDVLGLSEAWREVASFDGCINFMKSAIVLSDKITTVSETYSYEIRHAYFAHGLESVLKQNESKITGIVNGIDTTIYNPNTDKSLIANYKAGELDKKIENKKFLQERLGLPVNDEIPIIAMVSRLVAHKGLELVEFVAEELMSLDIQLVVLGTGDSRFEDLFKYLAYTYPQKMSANILFDQVLANQIYAGSDMFLMPSKSEPCGLSQLIAMRYGTIPIVRETGGLCDTVSSLNISTLEGSGFTFKGYNAHDMLGAINRAVDFYYNKENYQKVVKNIMKCDCSWKRSSKKYMDLYNELIM